jgi:hypothetical protein
VVLEDAQTGAVLARERFTAATLHDSARDEVAATLRCAPIERSRARVLRLRLSSPDGEPGRAFRLRARSDWDARVREAIGSTRAEDRSAPGSSAEELAGRWRLERDGMGLPGQLWIDLGFASLAFRAEARVGRFTLHGFSNATARFHVVGAAHLAAGEDESWERVHAPGFDPAREVVLERGLAAAPTDERGERVAARLVTLVSDVPGRVRLRIEAGTARWLVMSQPWYPGWQARVNGAEQPIWRANYAFGAVELPDTACEVELVYDPVSFRIASWLALISTVLTAIWVLASRRAAGT